MQTLLKLENGRNSSQGFNFGWKIIKGFVTAKKGLKSIYWQKVFQTTSKRYQNSSYRNQIKNTFAQKQGFNLIIYLQIICVIHGRNRFATISMQTQATFFYLIINRRFLPWNLALNGLKGQFSLNQFSHFLFVMPFSSFNNFRAVTSPASSWTLNDTSK